ncbi:MULTISPECIES: GtrA family protein [unclassified Caulobacter]|uniref:GtrA family protein n=1 Tax=unclassified Caulobacter TaxID=2648921 RepID=UPI0009E9FA3D|nr:MULTISPECIES: GtrA family protein [unclassified Caulobacter]AZS20617.1 GtrA family protein [Caulobacter sp. FWC26]
MIFTLAGPIWRLLPVGLRELILYGMASAAALAVDWGLLVLLTWMGVDYLVASGVGFCAGIGVAYALSIRMVFAHRPIAERWREFTGFLGVGLAGLLLTQGLMMVWVEAFGMAPAAAKGPTACFVFLFNFTVRRALLFRAPRTDIAAS